MKQNLVSISVTQEQQAAVLALIAQIFEILADLLSIDADVRRGLTKKGVMSDHFVRLIVLALEQNPDIVPPNLNVAEAKAGLAAYDMLLPILTAVQQLLTRIQDTRTALGSDLMVAANKGYSLLQDNGNRDGFEEILKEASYRYAKNRRKPKPEDPK
jgi:hypothetical protein